eukprot:2879300-Prymnesium_polylepis.1
MVKRMRVDQRERFCACGGDHLYGAPHERQKRRKFASHALHSVCERAPRLLRVHRRMCASS